jgi:TonB family protein
MAYQALLFCPDEKLARVVSQVFGELDFNVEPVQEPFAAVKKLMAQRYDAVVVDCDNEQNASLLFKSARNSGSNQSSLAIALVEGQAGVAKAYRIGANLVLTKPINVEQTKGTLRVARGLLRKNSDAAGGPNAAAPAVPARTAPATAAASFQPASRSAAPITPPPPGADLAEFEALPVGTIPAAFPLGVPATAVEHEAAMALAPAAETQIAVASEPLAEAPQTAFPGAVRSAAGSAAAPAPAKEVTEVPAESEHANPSHEAARIAVPVPIAISASISTSSSASSTDAPSFAVLGENQDSAGSGSRKKVLIAAAAILALAMLGYLSYEKLGKPGATNATPSNTPQNSGQPAPALRPMSSPTTAPSTETVDRASSASQTLAPKTAAATAADKPSAGSGNSPVLRIAASSGPGSKKQDAAPALVMSSAARSTTQAPAEESAPPPPNPLSLASANDSALNGLMSSAEPSLPKATMATLRISQGVSQGLLIKRVQPTYPQAALAIHAQGAVQIEATINKDGSVTNLKVLGGDPILAHAALEAVRQWRYKPYYLDGAPVEIQTQITVNFKAN